MPMYEYICEECGQEENRIVEIKKRDRQKCEQLRSSTKEEVEQQNASTGDGNPFRPVLCGGKLIRTEICDTAKMAVQWKGWAD